MDFAGKCKDQLLRAVAAKVGRPQRHWRENSFVCLRQGDHLAFLAGEVQDGDRVTISAEGNVLTFNGKARQTAEIAQFEAPVPKRKLN